MKDTEEMPTVRVYERDSLTGRTRQIVVEVRLSAPGELFKGVGISIDREHMRDPIVLAAAFRVLAENIECNA